MRTGFTRTSFTGRKRAAFAAMTGAAAAAVVGLAVAVPAVAAPVAARSAAAVSGTEHFQAMTTSGTATTQGVIAYGVFTGAGIDHEGNTVDTFVFSGGTFKVKHSSGSGPESFNQKTCLLTGTIRGTYTVYGGTGAYKGISGSGKYTVTVLGIAAKSKGVCSMTVAPVAWQQEIAASGPVKLP